MPTLDQHVAGDCQLHASLRLPKRAIVADTSHRTARRACEITGDQVKFTHAI
jgi:hypothetical protein